MLSLLTLTTFAAAAYAAALPNTSENEPALARRALSGQATYYGGNVKGGMCSFSTYSLPSGLYGTALSDSNWDNAGNCGGCVSQIDG
jgi:expansin